MKQLRLPGIFTVLMVIIACSQETNSSNTKSHKDWETLDGTDYSIQYPDSFNLDKTGQLGTLFFLFSNRTSQLDLFQENINLVVQDLSGQNIDLNKYVEISEEQIKTMLNDGKILASERLKNNSKELQRIIYTGKQGQLALKWLQYYWIENNKAYILTLTSEENQYDKYAPVSEEIMNTFIIK